MFKTFGLMSLVVVALNVIVFVILAWLIASLAVSVVKISNDQCRAEFVMEKRFFVQGDWFCPTK